MQFFHVVVLLCPGRKRPLRFPQLRHAPHHFGDYSRGVDLSLPLQRVADHDAFVRLPLLLRLQVRQLFLVGASAEEVTRQSVEEVHAVDGVALANGHRQRRHFDAVRLRNAERGLQLVEEFIAVLEFDEAFGFEVVVLPLFVEDHVVVLRQALLLVFGGLAEVFEDDGYIHVDDDEETDDEIGAQVEDGRFITATILLLRFTERPIFVHEAVQNVVPAGRGGDLEEDDHSVGEGLEVERAIDAAVVFHLREEGHADDGVDEHDEEEQQGDVEEGRQGDEEREEQCSDAAGRFDEPQDAADTEDTNDANESGGDADGLHHRFHGPT